jgi:hypothetical protein
MVGTAILIFLGETLMGTVLFVAFASLVKFLAEHQEATPEEALVTEQAPTKPVVQQPATSKGRA